MSITTRAPGARATTPQPAPQLATKTCRDVEAALVARNRRASAAILNAMRGWMAVGPYASVDDRRGVDGKRQVAIVSCPTRASGEQYAVIETEYFGFDWNLAAIPACPEVAVVLWTRDHKSAFDAATAHVLKLRAAVPPPPPTRGELVEAALVSLAEHVQEAVESGAYTDIRTYVREATDELLALGVGSQVPR
ncbi:hypothetical protein ACFRCG_42665 [Embleya sp. NPDC056575]|uniref:hypothetical protein n=1 Tax=unclassified Embleya TaxID=2699296 RepID=UPI0036AEC7C6